MTTIGGHEVLLSTALVLGPDQLEAGVPFDYGKLLLRFSKKRSDDEEVSVVPTITADGDVLFTITESTRKLFYSYDITLNDGESKPLVRVLFVVTPIGEQQTTRQVVLTLVRAN